MVSSKTSKMIDYENLMKPGAFVVDKAYQDSRDALVATSLLSNNLGNT